MSKIYTLREDDLGSALYLRIYLLLSKRRGGWQSAGAAFGLAGGMLSLPAALLLWAAARFIAPVGTAAAMNVLSNVFFALPLPLLALGAYCLDLLERKPPVLPSTARCRPARPDPRRRLRVRVVS